MEDRSTSAIVLAAGEGTRMRSNRPKPLHLLCGRAMVLYVLDALGRCDIRRSRRGRGRPRRRAGDQEAAGGRARRAPRLRRAARAARHRRRRERRASPSFPDDDLDDDDATCSCCPATRRCCGPTPSPRLRRAPPRHRRGVHGAHRPRATTPPATAGSCGARTIGCAASSSRPTPPTTSARSTRSTPRSTASAEPARRRRCAG